MASRFRGGDAPGGMPPPGGCGACGAGVDGGWEACGVNLKTHLLRILQDHREAAEKDHLLTARHLDDVEKRLVLMHESEVSRIETMLRAEEKAATLYRNEVDKRLDALNHSQERADRVQATYVPREVYERRMQQLDERINASLPRVVFDVAESRGIEERKEYQGWMGRVNETMARMAERRAVLAAVVAAVLALAGTIVNIVIQLLHSPLSHVP